MTTISLVTLPLSNIHESMEQLDVVNERNEEEPKKDFNLRELLNSNWKKFKYEIRDFFTFHPKEWINAFRRNPKYPLFVLGDIDGFVALFVNNLATLLAVIIGLQLVFESDIIYGKILPG